VIDGLRVLTSHMAVWCALLLAHTLAERRDMYRMMLGPSHESNTHGLEVLWVDRLAFLSRGGTESCGLPCLNELKPTRDERCLHRQGGWRRLQGGCCAASGKDLSQRHILTAGPCLS